MDSRLPILLFCVIVVSCFTSGFASSLVDFSVCNYEFELFRFDIEAKCPRSLCPSPPIEVDGDSLDRLMSLNHGNTYFSVLFYASWCPFSRALRPKFDMLSSMFPQIQHLAVEHSQALPSVFSRYGIHSLPSILMVNQTFKARYHGRKDLTSLIEFYEEATGLQPVQYVAEGEPTGLDASNDNLLTWLRNKTSIREIFKQDPFLVLSLLFICLRIAILVFPIAESRMKALWASYVPNLNLERFRDISQQLFSRGLHMVDVRRLWLKLSLIKTRTFHQRAKNAQAWASSLASVSLGQTSSDQS